MALIYVTNGNEVVLQKTRLELESVILDKSISQTQVNR